MRPAIDDAMERQSDQRQLLRWFGLLVAIGPVHMAEQMMFGLDTLDELKGLTARYYTLFENHDVGTVTMVIIIVTFVQLLLLGALAGGRSRLSVAAFFGVMGVLESHHVIQTIAGAQYFPGLVTAFGYVWIGAMILRYVARLWSRPEQTQPRSVAA